jgi:hypothetical protein
MSMIFGLPLFLSLTFANPASPPLPLAGYAVVAGMPVLLWRSVATSNQAVERPAAREPAVAFLQVDSAVPVLRLTVSDRLRLFHDEPVGLALTNTGTRPIAVDSALFQYRNKMVGGLAPGSRLEAARRGPTELVATATLFIDNPGAAARAPQPDEWRWRPGISVRSLPVLFPGEGMLLAGTVRLIDPRLAANADRLSVRLSVYRIDPATEPLYQLVATNAREVHPGNLDRRGVHPVRGLELVFRRPAAAGNLPRLQVALGLETIGPWAVETGHLEKRGTPDTVETHTGFRLEVPRPSLDEAHRRSGQSGSPSFYSYRLSAWCLPDGTATTVVGPAFLYRIAGDPTRLIETLDRDGRAVLDIAPTIASLCTAAGFPVQRTPEKGGGFRLTIDIDAARATAFLALTEREKIAVAGLQLMEDGR